MVVKLIDGIVKAIEDMCVSSEVMPAIYTQMVEQGIELPCFFVRCLNNSRVKGFDILYNNFNSFSVQYMPKSNASDECAIMSDMLFRALEYITVDSKLIRGTNLHCETKDEVLTFFADYNFNTYITKERNNMELNEINTGIKE